MSFVRTKWQYLVLDREVAEERRSPDRVGERESLEKVLDAYGDAGWELITAEFIEPEPWPDIGEGPLQSRTRRYRFFLKRPVGQSDPASVIK